MNPLIKKFGKNKIWVNYKLERLNGNLTKIPYSAIKGTKASSTDPLTWSTYKEAEAKSPKIGIVLHDQTLICIDIDHVLIDGKLDQSHPEKETIADLILDCDSYTEISQSRTGLHIFLELTAPISLQSHKASPYEVYNDKRYICTTFENYGEPRAIRKLKPEEALEIVNRIIPQKEKVINNLSTNNPQTSTYTDEQLLDKIANSKTGDNIKKLLDGDVSKYKGDESSADMALCMSLAFWTNKDANQMERLWLNSKLGQREKTQKRKDYRDRTIANAIEKCAETYRQVTIEKFEDGFNFLTTKDSKGNEVIVCNTENIFRVLNSHPEFVKTIRYDKFKNIVEINRNGRWYVLEESDDINIQTRISVLFPFFAKVPKQMVTDAIVKIAKVNEIDSAKDFITSLVWDQTSRLDSWLTMTFGTPNNIYHQKVGSNWVKGMIKRLVDPGAKFDYVLVLEGEQGVKKSTSLAILGGDWHTETVMSTESKDFFMQFAGKAIVEFSEGETMSRTEVKRMKAIITMQNDRYRLPYGKSTQDFPRRCVFAMTTNQTEYLKDETGNRRWLPVTVALSEANVEWLKENRDQLFAEAYHRVFNLKETIYEFPKEETLEAQNARMVHDPNEDIVIDWYYTRLSQFDRDNGITVYQVWEVVYNKGFASKLNRADEMGIAQILKGALKLEKKRTMMEGSRQMKWYPTEQTLSNIIEQVF